MQPNHQNGVLFGSLIKTVCEDEIKKENLALIYVPTGQMVADVLTKPLAYETFARHSSYMKGMVFPELEKKGKKRARFDDDEA